MPNKKTGHIMGLSFTTAVLEPHVSFELQHMDRANSTCTRGGGVCLGEGERVNKIKDWNDAECNRCNH